MYDSVRQRCTRGGWNINDVRVNLFVQGELDLSCFAHSHLYLLTDCWSTDIYNDLHQFSLKSSAFIILFTKLLKSFKVVYKMSFVRHIVGLVFCIGIMLHLRSSAVAAYDPTDKEIEAVLPKDGTFEAFYPRETHGIPNSAARAPHGHGSFFKYRNPALIDTKNAAAYGYRFDGKRRFNFDWI